jgi:hypothetical protein
VFFSTFSTISAYDESVTRHGEIDLFRNRFLELLYRFAVELDNFAALKAEKMIVMLVTVHMLIMPLHPVTGSFPHDTRFHQEGKCAIHRRSRYPCTCLTQFENEILGFEVIVNGHDFTEDSPPLGGHTQPLRFQKGEEFFFCLHGEIPLLKLNLNFNNNISNITCSVKNIQIVVRYCSLRGMGEKPSPSGEGFSMPRMGERAEYPPPEGGGSYGCTPQTSAGGG